MAAELVEDGNNTASWEALEAVLLEGFKQLLQHLLGPNGDEHSKELHTSVSRIDQRE